MTENKQKLRALTQIGLAAAMLCVTAPISIPIGDVPLSLTTLVILITAGMLGSAKSAAAVAVYLILGCVGLPVFSGFAGGAGRLLGPTGGYLMGYIPLALIAGIGRGKTLPMILGNVALCIVGTAWYIFWADVSPWAAILVCVVPYLPLDAVKIAVAAVAVKRIGKKM